MQCEIPHSGGLGIYVHFPWCLKKCPYCDFLSVAVPSDQPGVPLGQEEARARLPHEQYANAVIRELNERLQYLKKPWPQLRSLFFGGGTPSLWAPLQVGRVIDAVKEHFAKDFLDRNVEVTVECNPTSFDFEHAQALTQVGINRVSIGVQALDNERLKFLGRLHNEQGGLFAVAEALRAGLPQVSADLIFGVHHQSPELAVRDVNTIAETGITHLSAYALTIEPGTRFGALDAKGKLPLLEEAQVAASFDAVSSTLVERGFHHYEISNFAKEGHESVHNTGYWLGRDYLGLGTGAFGTVCLQDGRIRYKNVLSPERYQALWSSENTDHSFNPYEEHITEREVITPSISHQESLLLGLRTSYGVSLREMESLRGGCALPPERAKTVKSLISRGNLVQTGDRLQIPRSKWLFADGIIRDLL